ncbi:MAG: NFACT family protein [Planctomycetes bacterium]|nr:NFACT family protein [Planctomycetota bacterium]
MPMTAAQLAACIAELAPRLAGARLDAVLQPAEHEVVLVFFRRETSETSTLLLSTHPRFARAHLLAHKPQAPVSPPRFCQYLRAHLVNARVLSLGQTPEEALLRLDFVARDDDGRESRPALLAELFGRTPNVIFVDESGVIRDALHHEREGRRPVLPGAAYVPWPKPPPRSLPAGATASAPSVDPVDDLHRARGLSWNEAAELFLGEAERAWEVERRRVDLARRIARWKKRLASTLASLARAEVEAGGADEDLRRGELVKANLFRIRTGDEEVEVEDFYQPELPRVRLPLQKNLDGKANAERYFHRYRKRKLAIEGIARRKADVERQLAEVAGWEERAAAATRPEELDALAAALDRPRSGKAVREPKEVRRREGPRRFVSADGMTILVGQNAAENDELTLRIASGHDLWLHAQHGAGAHVVVRTPRGKTVPLETLLDAAALAAHFSKFRGAARTEVTYTERKHVTKPRRAPAGLVLVSAVKNLQVDQDPARLERLFASHEAVEPAN